MDMAQIGESIRFLLPMASIFLVFWFLIIRPQRREQEKKKAMLSALQKGDEVLTLGGIFAKVKLVKHKESGSQNESTVLLELSDGGATMRVLLSAIERVVKSVEKKEVGK